MFRGIPVVLLLHFLVVGCVVDSEPNWWKVYWLNSPLFDAKALLGPKLHHISKKDPELLKVFREAFVEALVECKRHTKNHRWNCEVEGTHPYQALFPTTSGYASREYAFLLALSTASAVRSIARACAQGRLRGCSCDPSKRGPVHSSPSKVWSPCGVNHGSDNIRYANRLTKRLIDRPFMCHFGDSDRQIHLHNIAVGRTRVKGEVKCECTAIFGTCLEQKCEQRSIEMNEIGDSLIRSLMRSRRIRRSNTVDVNPMTCALPNNEKKMRHRTVPLWFVDTRSWTPFDRFRYRN